MKKLIIIWSITIHVVVVTTLTFREEIFAQRENFFPRKFQKALLKRLVVCLKAKSLFCSFSRKFTLDQQNTRSIPTLSAAWAMLKHTTYYYSYFSLTSLNTSPDDWGGSWVAKKNNLRVELWRVD